MTASEMTDLHVDGIGGTDGTPWPPAEPEPGNMRLRRQRDNQQWLLDYLVKTTGRDRQFFYDERKFPAGTRSYAMIPKKMEKVARHKRDLARAAEAAGHRETALRLYQKAAGDYHFAHHALPFDNHPEKLYLYGQLRACFDKVIELSPLRMERVELDWEGHTLDGILYLAEQQPAPTVLHINGMDMVKELLPDPIDNPYLVRGMNCLVIDGPGQGAATVRKTRVTPDNFPRAMKTALDFLDTRADVPSKDVVCVGISMGTYWGMQLAAQEPRIKAIATHGGCYGPQYAIFQQASPHFKRQFMFMSGISDEAEFDAVAERYFLSQEELGAITCPVLFLHGEYDALCPLDEAMRVYGNLPGPKEFWLTEDDGHTPGIHPHLGDLPAVTAMADWLRDVLGGRIPPVGGRLKVLQERSGTGPYSEDVAGFLLPERLGPSA